jgi:hypothetical protein
MGCTKLQSKELRRVFGVTGMCKGTDLSVLYLHCTLTAHENENIFISSHDKLQQSYVRTTSSVLTSAGSFSLRYSFAARTTYCPQCFSI